MLDHAHSLHKGSKRWVSSRSMRFNFSRLPQLTMGSFLVWPLRDIPRLSHVPAEKFSGGVNLSWSLSSVIQQFSIVSMLLLLLLLLWSKPGARSDCFAQPVDCKSLSIGVIEIIASAFSRSRKFLSFFNLTSLRIRHRFLFWCISTHAHTHTHTHTLIAMEIFWVNRSGYF